jgi:hypothetical protein
MGKKQSGKGPTDYTVGHGKPPRSTRFQPGRSGNPGGRKKKSLNTRTILERVLNSEIVLSDHGQPREATIWEALFLRCVQSGLAGNQRSIEYALEKGEYLDRLNEARAIESEQDDQDLLDAVMGARQQAIAAAGSRPRQERSTVENSDRVIDPDDPDDEDDPSPRQPGSPGRQGRS